jgi:hypothetical protein
MIKRTLFLGIYFNTLKKLSRIIEALYLTIYP